MRTAAAERVSGEVASTSSFQAKAPYGHRHPSTVKDEGTKAGLSRTVMKKIKKGRAFAAGDSLAAAEDGIAVWWCG